MSFITWVYFTKLPLSPSCSCRISISVIEDVSDLQCPITLMLHSLLHKVHCNEKAIEWMRSDRVYTLIHNSKFSESLHNKALYFSDLLFTSEGNQWSKRMTYQRHDQSMEVLISITCLPFLLCSLWLIWQTLPAWLFFTFQN